MVFLADGQPATFRRKVRRQRGASGNGPAGEISAGQGPRPWEQIEDRHVPEGGHPHGKPASWMRVAVVITAFIAGGAAIITHAWWLLWACTAMVVLAVPAGKVIGIMDDTAAWGSTPAATSDPPQGPENDRGQDQPALPDQMNRVYAIWHSGAASSRSLSDGAEGFRVTILPVALLGVLKHEPFGAPLSLETSGQHRALRVPLTHLTHGVAVP